jgi:hypothetical protein
MEWLGELIREPPYGSERVMPDQRNRRKPYTLNHLGWGPVYAGFELELAGAERYGVREGTAARGFKWLAAGLGGGRLFWDWFGTVFRNGA